MKSEFDRKVEKTLTEFGYNPVYMSNFDDINCGFEFNPQPNVLIRFKYSMKAKDFAGEFCGIDVCILNIYDSAVQCKRLFHGQFILREDGDCDYRFYQTLLQNYLIIG